MNTEELLRPRYKVEEDWPGRRDFEVGLIVTLDKDFSPQYKKYEIEDCQGKRSYITAFFDQFPRQFKKLKWYEDRKPEDMPEYLKHDNVVSKVKEYGWFKGGNSAKFEDGTTEYLARSEPATLEEYEASQPQNPIDNNK